MSTEKSFTAIHVDHESEVIAWQVYGMNTLEVLRNFLMDVHPESESDLRRLETYDDLVAWARNRDCHVDLLPLN